MRRKPEIDNRISIDQTTKMFIAHMCKKCKFYNGSCQKKRAVRECVRKGLKNKD